MLTEVFKDKRLYEKYRKTVEEIKEKIKDHQGLIRVITHYDADGLASGAILIKMLYRLNKNFHLSIVEHLNEKVINRIYREYNNPLYIFCDMGSAYIDVIAERDMKAVILDHHPPKLRYTKVEEVHQLNPHIFNLNGAREISASGVCYLVAREYGFYDLSIFAIVGAIGDVQHEPFLGMNKFIVKEAREHGYLKEVVKDIIYNAYDLPIWQSIMYSTRPYIKELSDEESVINFLKELGIDPNKTYLEGEERDKLVSALKKYVDESQILVDRYIIKHKIEDAFYLSEILNACGKRGMGSVGIGVALEDEECIKIGKEMYIKYKRDIIEQLKSIELHRLNNIEYFFGKKGTIGHMASLLVRDKPVIGIYEEEGYYKISSRGNRLLVERGLDLSKAMSVASQFGGSGGGHNIAAGARIPKVYLSAFLQRVDEIVGEQLKGEKKEVEENQVV
ncbi:MAG TPA: DHH family phosphoesterase [Methanothermococcus okinawensis]|uniref:DHH family phosphoesterase n=1 Tax=Methanothermococcus okinawensis TaxID=155863 RepID=A0A832ZYA6_9EURY|nr:DHH family phosphoesterase [Methanothermococcus okinawensis]